MPDRYVAATLWRPERPESLVVCCSDGRWHAQIEEFIRSRVSDRADVYAVPGGPATFDLWGSSLQAAWVAEAAVRFLARHHDLRAVWLIAHEGCAYYRDRYGSLGESALRRHQDEDLRRARENLGRWWPRLVIRAVYASLEDSRVVFTTLAEA